jgi:AcrR family transcriptional regulator
LGKVKRNTAPKPRSATENRLDDQMIVERALELIDREGLEKFSIRTLAGSLGVYPAAIYWYVPNRNEILARVTTLATDKILETIRARTWQQFLRELLTSFREAIRKHPNVATLISGQMVGNSAHSPQLIDRIVAHLEEAGFTGPALVGAYNTVIAAMVGFATQEFAPGPTDDSQEWREVVESRVMGTKSGEYTALSRNLPLLANKAFMLRWQNGVEAPFDSSYPFYIEAVIAGLEHMAARKRRPGRG